MGGHTADHSQLGAPDNGIRLEVGHDGSLLGGQARGERRGFWGGKVITVLSFRDSAGATRRLCMTYSYPAGHFKHKHTFHREHYSANLWPHSVWTLELPTGGPIQPHDDSARQLYLAALTDWRQVTLQAQKK